MKQKIDNSYDFFEEDTVKRTTNEEQNSKLSWENFSYDNSKLVTVMARNNDSITINNDKSVSIRTKFDNTFARRGQQFFNESKYLKNGTYTSFSGADAIVSVVFKGASPVILGELATFTYSIFRPIVPVYSLGSAIPTGFVKGPRTIAGSLIFTIFDRHPLVAAVYKAFNNSLAECLQGNIYSDELPPFDFQVTFLNEYGQSSVITIYDVKITSEGQVMSIEDMITENTMQYMAKDIQLMTPDVYENN